MLQYKYKNVVLKKKKKNIKCHVFTIVIIEPTHHKHSILKKSNINKRLAYEISSLVSHFTHLYSPVL